jgi:hypothetical protein
VYSARRQHGDNGTFLIVVMRWAMQTRSGDAYWSAEKSRDVARKAEANVAAARDHGKRCTRSSSQASRAHGRSALTSACGSSPSSATSLGRTQVILVDSTCGSNNDGYQLVMPTCYNARGTFTAGAVLIHSDSKAAVNFLRGTLLYFAGSGGDSARATN